MPGSSAALRSSAIKADSSASQRTAVINAMRAAHNVRRQTDGDSARLIPAGAYSQR